MKVYRINFPDGLYYIGCTSQSLEQRLKRHLNSNSESLYKRKIFLSYGLSVDHIMALTEVLYDGWDAEFHESYIIFHSSDDENLINKQIKKDEPDFIKWSKSAAGIRATNNHIDKLNFKQVKLRG